MTDIHSWFNYKKKPEKNGTYLLMVGERNTLCGFLTVSIVKAKWSKGSGWDLKKGLIPVKWKYLTKADETRYHLERVK